MKRLFLCLVLLAGCGQAAPSGEVVHDDLVGKIQGISQGIISLETQDGMHTLGLVETSKIVDTSGAQRGVANLAQGMQVRVSTRHLTSGLDVVKQLTILPSVETASRPSVIEPPAQD